MSTHPLSPKFPAVQPKLRDPIPPSVTSTDTKIHALFDETIQSEIQTSPSSPTLIHRIQRISISSVVQTVKEEVDQMTMLLQAISRAERELSSDEEKLEQLNTKSEEYIQLNSLNRLHAKVLKQKKATLKSKELFLKKYLLDFLELELNFNPLSNTSGLHLISQDFRESYINFLGYRLKNHIVNMVSFLDNIKSLIKENISMIIQEFCPSAFNINPDDVHLHLELLGEETHNKGKCSVKVTLKSNEPSELCKFVYKPRDAETEMAIIELFRNLNCIRTKTTPDLPTYKIVRCGRDGSLWEFIMMKGNLLPSQLSNVFKH